MHPNQPKGTVVLLLIAATLSLLVFACRPSVQEDGAHASSDPTVFQNPVFEPVLADPTVFYDEPRERFYAYGTQDNWDDGEGSRLVPILESEDLHHWSYLGEAFESRPEWKDKGGIWAPDINVVDGRYYLYYSYSTWGDANPGVGLAIADSPEGPFVDQGKLFDSQSMEVPNSIDPFFIQQDDQKYIFWGSFSDTPQQGTYAVELSADGKTLSGKDKIKIAAGDFEAVTIVEKEGLYYFLGSKGSCCEGADSRYHVLVARSENLLGPYRDREGRDIRERGGGTVVLEGSDQIAGPGHTSGLVTDRGGTDWILYHGIDVDNGKLANGTSRRMLMLDKLNWQDGWPVIATGVPTMEAQSAPQF